LSGRFLLDTNIIIALFKEDVVVQKNLVEAEKVFIPAIVLGELYYGACKSSHIEKIWRGLKSLQVAPRFWPVKLARRVNTA